MHDKTQKIKEKTHKALKKQALMENKTLQELTEEIIQKGLKEKSKKEEES